eukprot:10853123-Heterocapsa_arctica.AAC.1
MRAPSSQGSIPCVRRDPPAWCYFSFAMSLLLPFNMVEWSPVGLAWAGLWLEPKWLQKVKARPRPRPRQRTSPRRGRSRE